MDVADGSKTFPIDSFPADALRYFRLAVAADGRHQISLGMQALHLRGKVSGTDFPAQLARQGNA